MGKEKILNIPTLLITFILSLYINKTRMCVCLSVCLYHLFMELPAGICMNCVSINTEFSQTDCPDAVFFHCFSPGRQLILFVVLQFSELYHFVSDLLSQFFLSYIIVCINFNSIYLEVIEHLIWLAR